MPAGFRFLVVDELEVGANVRRMVRSDDVVITALSASAACQRIRDAEMEGAPIDVVLCRINIDETRGQSIFRATLDCAQPPLFIYMARYCDDGIEAFAPADGILIKPFTEGELDELMVKSIFARSRERTRRLLSDNYN